MRWGIWRLNGRIGRRDGDPDNPHTGRRIVAGRSSAPHQRKAGRIPCVAGATVSAGLRELHRTGGVQFRSDSQADHARRQGRSAPPLDHALAFPSIRTSHFTGSTLFGTRPDAPDKPKCPRLVPAFAPGVPSLAAFYPHFGAGHSRDICGTFEFLNQTLSMSRFAEIIEVSHRTRGTFAGQV